LVATHEIWAKIQTFSVSVFRLYSNN